MSSPKFRRPLTEKQLYLLKLLYKFRFATIPLLANSSAKSPTEDMRLKLKVLTDQDYIGRNYDGTYRISGKPASFYLKPKAIQLLKDQQGLAWKVLHNAYKDKSASEAFISHCLHVFTIYRHLQRLLGEDMTLYSRSELAAYDHFPDKPPDAYITIKDQEYFLDLIETETPSYTVRRRLQSYIEHNDDGEWPEDAYPILLLVCETSGQERRLQRLTSKLLTASEADEIEAHTTTLKALLAAPEPTTRIWSDVNEPEEPTVLWSPIKK